MLRIRFETFCTVPVIGTELLRQIGVAAAARLQVGSARLVPHRRDVDDFELARACHERTQLITKPRQAGGFVDPRTVGRAFEAGVNQFEIEDGGAQHVGLRRPRCREHTRGAEDRCETPHHVDIVGVGHAGATGHHMPRSAVTATLIEPSASAMIRSVLESKAM